MFIKFSLTCPSGTSIQIHSAFFGKPSASCPDPVEGTCNVSVYKTMKEKCDGSRTCSEYATAANLQVSEPCSGTDKKLAVTYNCI